MKFKNKKHEKRYNDILSKMGNEDRYHRALAYLFALDNNITGTKLNDCFNFEEDCIKDVDEPWLTGFDRSVLMLGFHLWNSINPVDLDSVFGSNNEYLIEAIRIRYN